MRLITINNETILLERNGQKSITLYHDDEMYWGSTIRSAIKTWKEYTNPTPIVIEKKEKLEFNAKELEEIEKIMKWITNKFKRIDFSKLKIEKISYIHGTMGQYFWNESLIEIAKDLRGTLIHELAHFICYTMFGENGKGHDHKFNYILTELGEKEYWYNG